MRMMILWRRSVGRPAPLQALCHQQGGVGGKVVRTIGKTCTTMKIGMQALGCSDKLII